MIDALAPAAFDPRRFSSDKRCQFAPVVERVVAGLLEPLRSGEQIDLIEAYASAIPIAVISGLLGIPQHQRESLRAWSLSILGALESGLDAAARERGNQAVTDFLRFLETLIGARRSALKDADDDLLARLLRVVPRSC